MNNPKTSRLDQVLRKLSAFVLSERPSGQQPFVAWFLPGTVYPEEQFSFLERGMAGLADVDALQKARRFAKWVDTVPEVPTPDQHYTFLATAEHSSLSQRYAFIIRESELGSKSLDPETAAKYKSLRDKLVVKKSTIDFLTDEEIELSEPSEMVRAYEAKQLVYERLSDRFRQQRQQVLMAATPQEVTSANQALKTIGQQKKEALADWVKNGFKTEVERIKSYLEDIESKQRSFTEAWSVYERDLQRYQVQGGTPPEDRFYFTSISPKDLSTTDQWRPFVFLGPAATNTPDKNTSFEEFTDLEEIDASTPDFVQDLENDEWLSEWDVSSGSDEQQFGSGKSDREKPVNPAKLGGFLLDGKNGKLAQKLNEDCLWESLRLRCEVLVTDIERKWWHEEVFDQDYWRLSGTAADRFGHNVVSDGKKPPSGILTAYPDRIVLVRKLRLFFKTRSGTYEQFADLVGSGSSISFGPFQLLGKKAATGMETGIISGEGITHERVQVLGTVAHLIPASPRPNRTYFPDLRE